MGSKGQRSERFIRSCDRFKGGEGWGCPCHAVELMNSRSLMVRWRRLLLSCSTSNVLASTLYYFFFFFFTTSHLKDIYFTSVSLHIVAAFKIHPGPSARPTAEETCCKKPNTARSHTVQVSPKTHLHLIAETLLRPWPTEVTSCSDASI